MASAVTLSDEIVAQAKIAAEASGRSVEEQIEHWIKIGKVVEANSDLTYEFIKDILQGMHELEAGEARPYEFGG